MKVCTKCGAEKPLTAFYKRAQSRVDGTVRYYSHCKECKRQYHKDHHESVKKQKAEYYQKNKSVFQERSARYYRDNRATILARHSRYYQENKADFLENNRRRRARKLEVDENYTQADREFTLGLFQDRCFKCGSEDHLTIDHHIALSKGNALTKDNAVVLCKSCNSSKKARDPQDFYTDEELMEVGSLLAWVRRQTVDKP